MNIEKLIYQLRNWKSHARALFIGSYVVVEGALARAIGEVDRVLMMGTVHAKVIRADGSELSLGCIGKRVVTTAGVNYLRDTFAAHAGTADIQNFKFHACGTGVVAEAIGDTALGTDSGVARVTGTQVNSTTKVYQTVATMSFAGTLAITEHGIFSASTAGTLWDRTVFAAINVSSGDSIQFTYTLTITDGG
jgi:hypothetical protein